MVRLRVPPRTSPDSSAALLSAATRLRELECPVLAEMPALLQCGALRALHLAVNLGAAARPNLPAVAEFLRTAVERLESLVLDFSSTPANGPGDDGLDDAAELVMAGLKGAAEGAAVTSLRSLEFKAVPGREPAPHVPALAGVLHRLPLLARLDLGAVPTSDFLEEISAEVLPALQVLEARTPLDCPHAWAHSDDMLDLLWRHPRLHVVARGAHDAILCNHCCYRISCSISIPHGSQEVMLFSHPADDPCGVEHGKCHVHVNVDDDDDDD